MSNVEVSSVASKKHLKKQDVFAPKYALKLSIIAVCYRGFPKQTPVLSLKRLHNPTADRVHVQIDMRGGGGGACHVITKYNFAFHESQNAILQLFTAHETHYNHDSQNGFPQNHDSQGIKNS